MRRRTYIAAGFAMLMMTLAIGVMAQRDLQRRMEANVPYSFQVGEQTLPAGAYTFLVDTEQHRVQVIEFNTKRSVMVLGRPEAADTGGEGTADSHSPADQYTRTTGNERYYIRLARNGNSYRLYQVQGHGFGIVMGNEDANSSNLVTIEGRGVSAGTPQ